MGNCLRNNQISSAQDENEEGKKVERMKTSSSSKKVRFKIQDGRGDRGSHGNSTNGPRRIKLVVTKEELKTILSYKNDHDAQHTSLEQLLRDMKLREKRLYEVEEYDEGVNSWRPALESIPEDQSILK